MTPADRIREVLDAHGVDPNTLSLNGPRTLLGEQLERAMRAIIGDARWSQVDAIRDGLIDRIRAVEARHHRHLARLRWRASLPKHKPYLRAKLEAQRDRLAWRAWAAMQTGRSWIPPEWRIRAFVGPTNTDKDRAPIAGPKGPLP